MSGPRAVVVGGGIYGWGCALRLAELGAAVTVVDPRDVGDELRASGGITRVLRFEYGDRGLYSELTLRAVARWREIEATVGIELFRRSGVLLLVPEGDDGAWERASMRACEDVGVPGVELGAAEVARRWPAMSPAGVSWALFNAAGGFLWANRATSALAGLARAAGARHVIDRVVTAEADGVSLAQGGRVDADVVVLAAGAWSRLLVDRLPIVASRQVTAYLAGGPADVPVFGEGAPFAMYGMPAHDGYGLKVGSHLPGPPGDPDDPRERVASPEDVAEIVEYAKRRFGVVGDAARVVRADVCFYALTPSEDPVVDRLPDGRVVCAGFSGHGFKFAPVVAAAAAELALDLQPSVDLRPFRARAS